MIDDIMHGWLNAIWIWVQMCAPTQENLQRFIGTKKIQLKCYRLVLN